MNGNIWLKENKIEHLIQDDPSKYRKDAWGTVWFKYKPTGRVIDGNYEYLYVETCYS